MVNVFSVNWWINTMVQTFIIMIFIFLIKSILTKVNVPIVSDVVAAV